MKIELDKTYQMRNGETVKIVIKKDHYLCKTFSGDNSLWYQEDGEQISNKYTTMYDIIEEKK